VDFFCPKAELVIEVDSGQHYSGEKQKSDFKRDEYLKSIGLKVLRFSDREVLMDIDGVLENILENIGEKVG
jgi:very-short-patch-repair endonuclease